MQVYDAQFLGQAEEDFNISNYADSDLDKEDFLTLLVAQLQNQDPLNPMDDQDFTSQLAEFSQLEQLTAINSGVSDLSEETMQQRMVTAASYIGKSVRAVGDNLSIHDDGTVSSMYYLLGENAANVYMNIFDQNGNIVRTIQLGAQAAGEHEFEWDGQDWQGDDLAEGTYYVAMAAEDEEGSAILIQTEVSGVVEGVQYAGGYHYLRLEDGRVVAFDYVKEVVATETASGDESESDESSSESEETTEE